MAFNSYSYYANRSRKDSVRHLAEARDIKARAARGEAYDWEIARISHLAKMACLSARQARTYDALNAGKASRATLRSLGQ
jgi:hypothetical protein